jgi:hypothetical protein
MVLRRALAPAASLPSSAQIDGEKIPLVESSVVKVTFRDTRSDSPPGEDGDDGEEAVIIVPIASFTQPRRLSTIFEEEEEEGVVVVIGYEDPDDASSGWAEHVRSFEHVRA